MRYVIAALAILGIVVSVLAFQIHYSNAVQPCDINSHWDCGIVNHSRYAMIGPVPVAAIGIVGYFILGVLAFMRRRNLTLIASLLGLGYALYLTNIEAHVLEVWCLYCVSSQIIIALITLLAIVWVIASFLRGELYDGEPVPAGPGYHVVEFRRLKSYHAWLSKMGNQVHVVSVSTTKRWDLWTGFLGSAKFYTVTYESSLTSADPASLSDDVHS